MYALLLDWQFPPLSKAEAIACLDLEGIVPGVARRLGRLLLVDMKACDEVVARSIRRSALVREASRVVPHEDFCVPPEDVDLSALSGELESASTFCVRITIRDGRETPRRVRLLYERVVGSRIAKMFKHLLVRLEKPDVTVRVIYHRDETYVGVRSVSSSKKGFSRRGPGKCPFSHPSTLKPRLARTMVNLSRARPVGCEISRRMCRRAKSNLLWSGIRSFALVACDSLSLPITRCHSVVTDPPYGELSSTAGRTPDEIYDSLLSHSLEVLPKGGRLVFMHPATLHIPVAQDLGFVRELSLEIPVHGSRIRRLRVFRKFES
ncbi:MAG: THUMP domain-containing protein [Candidatus Geothermarchaeales archaeon]